MPCRRACPICERNASRKPLDSAGAAEKAGLELPGFGQFHLDPQFDLGQDAVEAGIAG
jgi:hypothetical protein